ncbi:sensor histidine kinase [Streptomyces sp. LS1784]|uniref:sensor histidine kinase n=1 Tax=Streptomyces sp. LS1784 TaxID=2851533 RepID=UPI001CD000BC|nr:sensor histidine kinase [Streptomyces sp. LS1784]
MKSDEPTDLRRFLVPLPVALLGVATVLCVVQPEEGAATARVTVFPLVAVTAAWTLAMYTLRSPAWTGRIGPMLTYAAGQQVLAALLMTQHPIFFVFAVIGFVQAYDLLPPQWAFVSVGATSLFINLIPGGIPDTSKRIAVAAASVCLQTCLIGLFGNLSHRFNERSEERRRLVAELKAVIAENNGLHAQLLIQAREAGIQDERQRMAREIHDTIAQGLAGIVTQLQAADQALPRPEQREWHLEQARLLARESLTAARRSVAALRPAELEEAHLPNAIQDLARRWSAREGVPATVEATGDPVPLLTEIEIALFRVAQETLANIAKHAGASRVRLTISYLEDTVMLDVHDDGVGFTVTGLDAPPPADGDSGYGLDGLRRRLDRVLGTLIVESAPGSGTAVNASVPAIRRGGAA